MSRSQSIILSCDIGGTNASLAFIQYDSGRFTTMERLRFQSRDAASMSEILRRALNQSRHRPQHCCIAAAGPIKNEICYVSNLPWNIDRRKLEEEFNIPIKLINDFTAIALSLPLLESTQLHAITDHHTDDVSTYVVVGAGTGLGVGAVLRSEKAGFVPIASEGGHADIFPSTSTERELFSYWQEKTQSILEGEFFVSGSGMERIFQFWKDSGRFTDITTADRILKENPSSRPALITELGAHHPDCRAILSCFLHLYGRVAANACLYFSGHPALFIGGGIITHLTAMVLSDPSFLQGFSQRQHPKMKEYLQTIPIFLITDYSVSLLGAAHALILEGNTA